MADVEVLYYDGYRALISLKNFRQGETILHLPFETRVGPDKYSIEVWPDIHLDCSSSFAGAINHSCEPNAAVKNGRIIAWTCIKEDDEITLDYKKTETSLASPFDCNCGSKKCRGRIE